AVLEEQWVRRADASVAEPLAAFGAAGLRVLRLGARRSGDVACRATAFVRCGADGVAPVLDELQGAGTLQRGSVRHACRLADDPFVAELVSVLAKADRRTALELLRCLATCPRVPNGAFATISPWLHRDPEEAHEVAVEALSSLRPDGLRPGPEELAA